MLTTFTYHRRMLALALSLVVLAALPAATSAAPPADDPSRAKPAEVLVGFEPDSSSTERERAARKVSGERKEKLFRGRGRFAAVELVDLPAGASNAAAIAELEREEAVAYAEPNWIVTKAAVSDDPYFTGGSLWGMYGDLSSPANQYGSQAAEAWAANHTGSKDVYVGVIDEGIQHTHADLSANRSNLDPANGVDDNGNGYVDDTYGWDFVNNDNTVYDGGTKGRLDKHGTHVAGTIGAQGGNAQGVAGVNWDVTYISGKFLGRNGGTTANAIKAVDYFTDLKTRRGINLVATNNSWGGGGYSQALLDAINRGGDAGILFVAAAGNGGSDGVGDDNDKVAHYPSNYSCTTMNRSDDCVVAVAALTSTGSKASYSNYGLANVDLGAPGSGIYSTLPFGKYGSYSGTSMATPHVTGAAALFASSNPSATMKDIRDALLNSPSPTPSMDGKTVTGGRLNAEGF